MGRSLREGHCGIRIQSRKACQRKVGTPVQQHWPLTSVHRPLLPTEAAAQTKPVCRVMATRPSAHVPTLSSRELKDECRQPGIFKG